MFRERLLFGVVSVVVLVATGLVTTMVVDGTGREMRPLSRELAQPVVTLATSPPEDTVECRAPITPDVALRLWIGGDSLAGSLGPALGERTGATGVVAPVYDTRSGSGLSTPDFFDWPEHAGTEMDRLDPEIIVFIMGTNDWAAPSASTGTTTSTTSEPDWRIEYADRVQQMLDLFHGDHDRFVYWVGAPPLRDKRADAGVREINAVAREIVELDEHAQYFDEYALFESDTGGYTATLPRPGKSPLRVRSDDGVHFTDAGGEVLGDAVYEVLDRRCRLDDQAVAGVKQPVVRVPGSTDRGVSSTTVAPPAPSSTSTTTSTVSPTSTSSTSTSPSLPPVG